MVMHNGAMLTPPTSKIRVTVPVSLEVLERFKRLSQVAGQSVGRAMGEWLESTQEGLDPMIAILEEYKTRPAAAVRSLQDYASSLDTVTADLFQRVRNMDAGAVSDRASGVLHGPTPNPSEVRKRGLTPPSSNTGGKGRKTAKKGIGGPK